MFKKLNRAQGEGNILKKKKKFQNSSCKFTTEKKIYIFFLRLNHKFMRKKNLEKKILWVTEPDRFALQSWISVTTPQTPWLS